VVRAERDLESATKTQGQWAVVVTEARLRERQVGLRKVHRTRRAGATR
jgi:hypothetical protein